MIRYVACVAVLLLVGATLKAGELDKEFGTKAPPAPAREAFKASAASATDLARGSELDEESPAQSCRFIGWRGCAWGGCGWYGCGWRTCGWYGCGRPAYAPVVRAWAPVVPGWGGGFVATPWASVSWGSPVRIVGW